MKHLSKIQSEFLKLAVYWNELSAQQQRLYLRKHPKSKRRLTAKPDKTMSDVNLLSSIISSSQFSGKAFLAGGFIRDKILGKPSKDVDITVAAPGGGIALANYISKKLNIREPVIFPTFGTAKIQLPSGLEVEFVQTRNEEYVRGNRKPSTSFGTIQEDVERRDFTINTLLFDLTSGKVLDLTNKGLTDLENGIIRTPLDPDITFQDDALRMMRAVRFATKYNFEFASNILPSISKNANELQSISKERIQEELNKILITDKPSRAFKILKDTGLLKQFMPELLDLVNLQQGKFHHADAWNHTLEVLDNSNPTKIDRLAALLHDVGKPAKLTIVNGEPHFYEHEKASADLVDVILRRLRYPLDEIDKVKKVVNSHMRVQSSSQWSNSTVRRFVRDMGEDLPEVMNLIRADRMSHHPEYADTSSLDRLENRIKNIQMTQPVTTVLPVTGHEIMQVLNITPGPQVGKAISYLQELLLEQPNMTKDEAIAHLKSMPS
jgi:poly(A) polymerase